MQQMAATSYHSSGGQEEPRQPFQPCRGFALATSNHREQWSGLVEPSITNAHAIPRRRRYEWQRRCEVRVRPAKQDTSQPLQYAKSYHGCRKMVSLTFDSHRVGVDSMKADRRMLVSGTSGESSKPYARWLARTSPSIIWWPGPQRSKMRSKRTLLVTLKS
jgi:hypothetical protein